MSHSPPPSRTRLDGTDPAAIASAAVRSLQSLQSRLAPVIGEDGFRLLYARSLHRARAAHPWLAREAKADHPYSDLKASLEAQLAADAQAASTALLDTFGMLLNNLIGATLARRLMDDDGVGDRR